MATAKVNETDAEKFITSELKTFIGRHEGMRPKAYKDSRGFWTWGCGCRIMDPLMCEALEEGTKFTLTPDQAEKLLSLALLRAAMEAEELFPAMDSYSPARRAALISLSFQFGKWGLARFTNMCAAVRQGAWERAADELRFKNGLTKMEKSDYAVQCPERCEETAGMLETGEWRVRD